MKKINTAKALLSVLLLSTLTPVFADPKFTENGDGTITDKRNGLIWKLCAEGQTWVGNTCTGNPIQYRDDEYLKITSNFSGFNDWRIPTIHELEASLPYDDGLFPNQPLNKLIFWSTTTVGTPSYYTNYIYTMQFGNPNLKGYTQGIPVWDLHYSNAVRLVRGSMVIDHRDGTYTDNATGLMWKVCAEGATYTGTPFIRISQSLCTGNATLFRRKDAKALTSNFAGYSDWRLPTDAELENLKELKNIDARPSNYLSAGDIGILSNPYIWSVGDNSEMYSYLNANVPAVLVRNSGTKTNQDIEIFYAQFQAYFGAKSGDNYSCYTEYTCQKFDAGKIIAAGNTNKLVWWYDGTQWNRFK